MIKWNRQFHYPTSSRKIIDGKRHYLVGERKITVGDYYTVSYTEWGEASVLGRLEG